MTISEEDLAKRLSSVLYTGGRSIMTISEEYLAKRLSSVLYTGGRSTMTISEDLVKVLPSLEATMKETSGYWAPDGFWGIVSTSLKVKNTLKNRKCLYTRWQKKLWIPEKQGIRLQGKNKISRRERSILCVPTTK